jgi:GTP-binding protein HflX
MGKLLGNTKFLKKNQIKKLESLFNRKIPSHQFFTLNCLKVICKISREIYKQIGVVSDRNGNLQYIVIGEEKEILWPTFYEFHLNRYNLRGITVFHTHLHNHGIDNDDLTDLAYLRLDFMGVIISKDDGSAGNVDLAKIVQNNASISSETIYSGSVSNFNLNYHDEIYKLENSLKQFSHVIDKNKKKVILVVASNKPRFLLEEEMEELSELAKAADFSVADKIIQRINKVNPSLVLGKGKFKELIIGSLFKNVQKIIFYDNLTPAQAKYIAGFTDIEVIDRTTLILNIFARRALSKEGKLKVELAKLKYLLPRVAGKAEALSRIRGGIGLKGPGETASEVEKRRIKDRIKRIEKELSEFAKRSNLQRKRREKNRIPVVSIIGYTNAGKSTLINALTGGELFVENLLFATLDTYSRKLYLSENRSIIVTDTVGFIRNLPKELFDAFRTTIEELKYSDLLIHVVDISHENFPEHIETVKQILYSIEADTIPSVIVFNKTDKIDFSHKDITERYNALAISAKDSATLKPLIEYLKNFFI